MALKEKPGLMPRSCEVCHKTDSLLRCSGCQAVYYCNRDHQTSDRNAHKRGCTVARKARAKYHEEEQKLRDTPGDMFLPENVFENGIGQFWGIFETRPYMRARYGAADALLLNFGSFPKARVGAVETALDHMLDMFRLCRSDNLGLRSIVPSLYVTLDRDQEAYDFMRWWAVKFVESDYDWGDISLPYLDIKDADIMEPPLECWNGRFLDMSHTSAVLLIKLRILADLRNVQNATRALTGTLAPELIELIREHLVTNQALKARPDITKGDTDDLALHIKDLKGQALEIYRAVNKYSPRFWRLMKDDPVAEGKTRPPHFSPGSDEEAYLMIGYNDVAWRTSPTAMKMLFSMEKYG